MMQDAEDVDVRVMGIDQQMKSPFGSSFRTFDATDYKPIGRALWTYFLLVDDCQNMGANNVISVSFLATVDVKRNIFDLCTDTKDCYLAVIEVTIR